MDATPPQPPRHGDINTRTRFFCVAALGVFSAIVAFLAPGEVPGAALAVVAGWALVRALECRTCRPLTEGAPTGVVLRYVASHALDVACGLAYVHLVGGGLWVTSWVFVFFIASAIATLPLPAARALIAAMLAGVVALLGAQAAGVVAPSPLFGLGALASEPRVAVATAAATTLFGVLLTIALERIVRALRRQSAEHRAVLESATDAILVLTADGTVRQRNRAAMAASAPGSRIDVEGLGALVLADDLPLAFEALATAAAGAPQALLLRARSPHGSGVRWWACTLSPMRQGKGAVHLLAMLRDVSEERRAAEAVRRSEARLRAVFDQAAVAIALTDLHGVFLEANPAIERLLGHDAASLAGCAWTQFVPQDDHGAAQEALAAIRAGERESASFEQRFVRRDGRVVWAQLTVSRAESPDGRDGLVVMLQDVTERRALEAQLTWQAYHDPLTNLANRTLFRDRVDRALVGARTRPGSVAVLFLDLDNFKTVNDSLGHAAGDQLLFEVARRLLNATRGCDTVARLGGDEFAILLDNIRTAQDAIVVAERVLAGLHAPVLLEGREVIVGGSVGIVRAELQESADELLRDADVAMYDAKQAGKNRYAVFEPRMHVQAVARMQLEADLRVAIESGEFSLVFQPIVRLESGRPVHLEALVRWVHPSLGPVGPDVFVPLAEETGLIVPLGRWILAEACRACARWNAALGGDQRIGVTVNVSPRQLEEPGIVAQVGEALAASGLAPDRLVLEITETGLVGGGGATEERLHALKGLGVALAIDDFGTGYSSLGYIQRFPVDVLKIDKVFVDGLRRGTGHEAALARTIVGLGASLGLRTVAEGIETDAQRAILAELGCAFGQGYLFARPLAEDDIAAWLAKALGLPLPTFGVPLRPRRRRPTTGDMVAVSEGLVA